MRARSAVWVALLAAFLLFPTSVFSKGKKPPTNDSQDEAIAGESGFNEDTEFPEAVLGKESQKKKSPKKTAAVKEPAPEVVPEPAQEQVPETVSEPEPAREQNQVQAVPEGTEKVHRVWIWQESRDCLWKLAKLHYKDPWQWKKIYLANRNEILDPNVIFPKQRIVIPPLEPQDQ